MKKCWKCNSIYDDKLKECPECHIMLTEYTNEDIEYEKAQEKQYLSQQLKQIFFYICIAILVFFLGFGLKSCTSVKRTDYNKLQTENENLSKEYEEYKLQVQKANIQKQDEKNNLLKEYEEYQKKMRPYEEQQAADAAEQAKKEAEEKAAAEAAAQAQKEAEEQAAAEAQKQALKHRENMYGISDKRISSINDKLTVSNVRNDKTGNWRIVKITDNIKIEEYVLDYYRNKFTNPKEIHWIVNFTNKTTTCISNLGGSLSVVIHEYVENEEHDAAVLGAGIVLAKFSVYLDNGDIEQLK